MRPTAFLLPALALAASGLQAGTRQEAHTLPLKTGDTLVVSTRNSPIEVRGWDKEEVAVRAEISDTSSRPVRLELRPTSGRLEIEAVFPEHWGFHFGKGPACALTLTVPRRLVAEFRTSNARLEARGLGGELRFTTSNARMVLEDLTGTVEARTSNGALRVRAVNGDLRATTSNASVEVDQVSGRVDAATSNGAVHARQLDGQGKGIRLTTSNASLELDLGKAAGEIDAATSRHEPIKVERTGVELVDMSNPSHVRMRIPGSTQRIELRTSNGGITLR